MHLSYQALLAAMALQVSTVLSHPVADRPPPPPPPRYVVTSQVVKDGTPFNAGLSVLAGGSKLWHLFEIFTSECWCLVAVGFQEQYAIGYTIQLGGNLGLNIKDILDVGLSASVAMSTETAIATSASYQCPPGGWTCALQVLPSVLDVKGHVTNTDILGITSGGDYEVSLPRTDHNGNAVAQVTICACHNRRSWADPGAPPLCPQDCN